MIKYIVCTFVLVVTIYVLAAVNKELVEIKTRLTTLEIETKANKALLLKTMERLEEIEDRVVSVTSLLVEETHNE